MAKKSKPESILQTTYDEYKLGKVLGEGGAGRVYSAVNSIGEDVAIKILAAERATTEKRRRFKNETRFLTEIKHPNIVPVIDHGVSTEGTILGPFYVMKRFEANLRAVVSSELDDDAKLNIFGSILHGVEAAHLKEVIHRDIKPENILLNLDAHSPAIADFGIASFKEEISATIVETKPSTRLANFMYAAPEQRVPGTAVSVTCDIYALGLILNELFTGSVPLGTNYVQIESVNSDFGFLDAVVSQMIQQDPGSRLSSVVDVKRAIAQNRSEFLALQKLSRIDATVVPDGEIDEPLAHDPPKLVSVDWNSNRLTLTLDRDVNAAWVNALNNMRSRSAVVGYGPEKFSFRGNIAEVDVISSAVQAVVDHFKKWLPNASGTLKQILEEKNERAKFVELERLRKQKQAEEERLEVLKKLNF